MELRSFVEALFGVRDDVDAQFGLPLGSLLAHVPIIAQRIGYHVSRRVEPCRANRVAVVVQRLDPILGLIVPEVHDPIGASSEKPALVVGVEGDGVDGEERGEPIGLLLVALEGDGRLGDVLLLDVAREAGDVGAAVEGSHSHDHALRPSTQSDALQLGTLPEVGGVQHLPDVGVAQVGQQDALVGHAGCQGGEADVGRVDLVLGVDGHNWLGRTQLQHLDARLIARDHKGVPAWEEVEGADRGVQPAHLGHCAAVEVHASHRPVHQSHEQLRALVVPCALDGRRGELVVETLGNVGLEDLVGAQVAAPTSRCEDAVVDGRPGQARDGVREGRDRLVGPQVQTVVVAQHFFRMHQPQK